jgi:hypothetical protein
MKIIKGDKSKENMHNNFIDVKNVNITNNGSGSNKIYFKKNF